VQYRQPLQLPVPVQNRGSELITLEQAERIVDGTLERATELGAAPLAVSVLDGGGNLVVMKRADGAGVMRAPIALAKAYGAVGMGLNSRELARRSEMQPVFFGSLAGVTEGRFAPAPGGVLIRDEDGVLLGAVGVSGDTSDMDEACAIGGVSAAGLRPDPVDPVVGG
jgi:uncharacterized protein GlcG (DUF336 family)